MGKETLNMLSVKDLRVIAGKMKLKTNGKKSDIVDRISDTISKKKKWTRIRQLGNEGKEAMTYLVEDSDGKEYAMKTFRKKKSSAKITREYNLQLMASLQGIAPKPIDMNDKEKYIVMEKLDTHLIDVLTKQKGRLTKAQQLQIIDIFEKLDVADVFQGDANLTNYMLKGKTIYIIDFGFAAEITPKLKKKLGTNIPNMTIALLGFALKLKEIGCPFSSYRHLIKKLDKQIVAKFNLNG
jgi:tRNA A-37 threonylcarbamoyl transferase component Bud32